MVHLEASRVQGRYVAGGEGAVAAQSETSFELAAVRFRSLDVSINLATGELTAHRSALDAVSVRASDTRVLAGAAEATEQLQGAVADADGLAQPGDPTESAAAAETAADQPEAMASESIGEEATDPLAEEPDETTEPFFQALGWMTRSVQQLETFLRITESRFETSFAIRDSREEEDDEGDRHLRFTLDTVSPIGLTERDEDGRGTTVYPRLEGTLGKIEEAPVDVSA
jgi:hypothetical protein